MEPGAEYEHVRDHIIATMQELRDPHTGERVVQWARRREEVFAGDHVDEAPDVVVLFHPAYKGASGLDELFEAVPGQILEEYSGVHAMEGIFAAAGRGIREGVDLGTRSILDVAPTLLALLGRPVPADADGSVMDAALEDAAAVRTGDATARDREDAGDAALTAEEEATLEESLRALGYLE